MLSDIVSASIEPEVLKLLQAVKAALAGVRDRLAAQQGGSDLAVALSAHIQQGALEAWAPAIDQLIDTFTKPAAAPHPAAHDFSGHGH